MDYTLTPTKYGSVQVSQGGKVIGTGSSDWANTNYGPGSSPTPTPTPTPTPSSNATGRYPTGYTAPASNGAPAQSPISSAESQYQTDTTPEDPSVIASRIQSEYAAEIQSIKNYYAGLTSAQTTSNVNESGKTRALTAASGELGQDIGNTQQTDQDNSNQSKLDLITKEEQAAEGAVTGQEAAQTESEIQSQKTTQQNADTQRLSFLKDQASQAQSQISSIATSSDLSSLPQDEYDSLYEASGFSTPEQFNTYYNAVRQSGLLGAKTIGDATTGVYQQQTDGTYKKIIPGTKNTIGDPSTGVWSLNNDGTYTNVIPAAPKIGSIGAGGSYVLGADGTIKTIKPQANKIVSSGGVIYAVDPSTNKAIQLTTTKNGWNGATGSSGDQEKAAIIGYVNSLTGVDPKATLDKIQSDPTTYYQALSAASNSGFFTPINLGNSGTNQQSNDMIDASTNASIDAGSSDTGSGQ